MIFLQVFTSLVVAYFTIIFFNWYNLGVFSFKVRQLKTWLKIIPLAIPYFFVANAIFQTSLSTKIDFDSYQNLPNYLMFFTTLLSIYLLYRALVGERKSSQLSAFENRFFKFMDYHRANVENLKYKDPKSVIERYWEGFQVFTVIYYEIQDVLKEVEKNHPAENDKEKQIQNINQAFQFVFYGAGKRVRSVLESKFEMTRYGSLLTKTAAYSLEDKFYTGHVGRLGHYFRNIYQMVRYVESKEFLTPYEKYEYITHFRAQMSVYEQAVFFFNSLSDLGNVWELQIYNNEIPEKSKDKTLKQVNKEKRELYNKLLITKYDFVRNTLNDSGNIFIRDESNDSDDNSNKIFDINIKAFYPIINLEGSEECTVHGVLPFTGNGKEICRCCFNHKYIGYENKNLEEEVKDYYTLFPKEISNFKCDEKDCKVTKELTKIKEELQKL